MKIIYLTAYFYPEKYIKTESGEYVLVEAMHASNTFPVTKDTQFVVEHYYTKDDRTLTEHVGNIPVLIGCDKKQLEEYLKTYMKDLSKEELALGLTTYQLVSYKDNEICLRKTYEKPKYEGYYAKSNNGTIVILNGDAKTVYEYTSISIHVLPEGSSWQCEGCGFRDWGCPAEEQLLPVRRSVPEYIEW